MLLGRKKSSLLDQRLKDLQKEMTRIQREIKSGPRPERTLPARETAAAPPSPAVAAAPPKDDLFAHTQPPAPSAMPSPSPTNPAAVPPPAAPPAPGRERFASYFMAGHFQDMRPPRQETRVIRAKAIVVLILILLALFWLYYFFGTH